MTHLSIRGLDEQAMAELKRRAADQGASVNTLVLQLIDRALGRSPTRSSTRRHADLDALAGCWTEREAADFDRATAAFRDIEPGLWA